MISYCHCIIPATAENILVNNFIIESLIGFAMTGYGILKSFTNYGNGNAAAAAINSSMFGQAFISLSGLNLILTFFQNCGWIFQITGLLYAVVSVFKAAGELIIICRNKKPENPGNYASEVQRSADYSFASHELVSLDAHIKKVI
uniref:Uncharacterized protein n=1 Tax=Panagrolaimus davidi TaxID=227884 RepID=A0A914QKY5_9BILA